jgi:hypothetical protein
MGSEQDKLLYYTEVGCLSPWIMLSHLSERRSEVQIFLSDNTSDLSSRFTDEMCS